MTKTKLHLPGGRHIWVADVKRVVPGQLRVSRAINKLDGMGTVRHFLFVIGDTGEPGRGYDASKPAETGWARTFMKWLVLRSDGVLATEYLSTLEGMYLVSCDDPEVNRGNVGA